MGATVTVYAPFLLSIGLTLGEVALVNSVFWAVMILAELPTGMLADGRSRAWSLKVGVVLQSIGAVVYLSAVGFWTAALAEAIVAVGMAFLSGAQSAWIADALTREGKFDDLRHVYATELLIRTPMFLVGGAIGALLALVSYRLIWVPLIVMGIVTALTAHRFMNGQGEPLEQVTEKEALLLSLRHLRSSRALKWVIATMIVFGCVVSFNHFWAPFFEPKVGTLGLSWVWAIIYLSFIPSGWMVRKLGIGAGQEGKYIVLSILMSGLGLMLIGVTDVLVGSLVIAMFHEFGRGMFQPLTDSFVQHRVKSAYRATFGSLQSFLGKIGFAVVPFVVWLLILGKPDTPETITKVWVVCGAIMVVGSLALFVLRPKKN